MFVFIQMQFIFQHLFNCPIVGRHLSPLWFAYDESSSLSDVKKNICILSFLFWFFFALERGFLRESPDWSDHRDWIKLYDAYPFYREEWERESVCVCMCVCVCVRVCLCVCVNTFKPLPAPGTNISCIFEGQRRPNLSLTSLLHTHTLTYTRSLSHSLSFTLSLELIDGFMSSMQVHCSLLNVKIIICFFYILKIWK